MSESYVIVPIDEEPIRRAVFRSYEAARYLGCTEATLTNLRKRRDGPPYVRLSSAWIGYRREDLDAWIAAHVEVPD